MPPHIGTIVSQDETGTVVLAELIDSGLAGQTYQSALQLASAFESDQFELHVGGPGAVSGYLGEYIDQDARKLQPLVFVLVLGFIYFAFRRFGALPGPLLVVIGAAVGSLGIMAWLGVPYYAITNALPVIVVAISVADAIHILSGYFKFRAQLPDEPVRGLVVRSMVTMARPITLTTLTTIAGFAGIGIASIMPPITAFAWFAAVGVALAWVFSIFALPNMLVLLRLGPSPAFENWRDNEPSGIGRFLARIGALAAARYVTVLCAFAVISAIAVYGALQLRVDRSQVENFAPGEAIRVADETINARFAGTAFLDVVIETAEPGGLLDSANMQRVLALQSYFESLPFVQKTIGITDYLDRLHRAIGAEPVPAGNSRALPTEEDSIAQYLLVYEMSGDPTDFEEEIDYGYQNALIRGVMNTHYFSDSRPTVEALQTYIEREFNDASMTASLTGDVSIGYHWMSHLERSHFLSVGLSLLLVLATSVLVFGSLAAGFIAVVPVTFAVLVLYAVMGYLGIYLEPATSMFAAIALGVGVDFGIHLVERMREAYATHSDNTAAAVDRALPPTARACFFNSAALGLGFAVLLVSDLPTLQRFGGLVAVAAVSSYVAALIIVPALFAAESALWRRIKMPSRATVVRSFAVVMLLGSFGLAGDRAAAEEYSADEIAALVAARPEGKATSRSIDIILTNRKGRTKKRRALVLKESREMARYTRITYTEPKTIRDTSFLSHDFHDASNPDNRWFYMPATRKVRRVPASDRGDYFLGTDFTYEDIQSELKFDLDDYTFRYEGNSATGGTLLHHVVGAPVSRQVAKELGYGAFRATIDASNWMPTEVEFFDLDEKPLKTIYVEAVEQIDGIWTATNIRAINHKTGHQTEFRFHDVSYPDDLADQYFEPPALSRGLSGASLGGL
jgi:predicted RND superfamily exporter protein